MRDNLLILNLFNKILKNIFFNERELSLEDLNIQNNEVILNTNQNNVFDSILDIIVFSVGASYKLQMITQIFPLMLVNSKEEGQILERIINWNKKRNLNVFNFRRELAFIVEEVYEGTFLNHNDSHNISLKIVDKYLFDLVLSNQNKYKLVQSFFIDLYKSFIELGKKFATFYEKNDVFHYLNMVMDANDKKGNKLDSEGKVIKDKQTFIEPETNFKTIIS